MVMSFTPRQPSLQDAPQIAELIVAAWPEAYPHLLSEDSITEEHALPKSSK